MRLNARFTDMKAMRADMGGAAVTVSALWAIAKLRMPINMVLCTPLTDNSEFFT